MKTHPTAEPSATPVSRWSGAEAYERYLGRWSAQLAPAFVRWLAAPEGGRWLDVGCGTGALTQAITDADPSAELEAWAVDPSASFVDAARTRLPDHRVNLQVASADHLSFESRAFDYVVSGLVLNFLPDPRAAVVEMARVCRPDGTVAAYVWDYTGGMWLLRHLWEAAIQLVPDAAQREEVRRFEQCQPDPLRELFAEAGLQDTTIAAFATTARFRDFDDYWTPFLAGQGAAPAFVASLPEATRAALAASLQRRLPASADGSIEVGLRIWAVRGQVPA